MRIVCWQAILMKYYTLFFFKIKKDVASLSRAAVVIGALRVNPYKTIVLFMGQRQIRHRMMLHAASDQECSNKI